MSVAIDLADVKAALQVTHDSDDALLTRLIGSAIRECLAFLDSDELPSVEDVSSEPPQVVIPEDVFQGIVLIVGADYEVDPTKRRDIRAAAEGLWMPYRQGLGV